MGNLYISGVSLLSEPQQDTYLHALPAVRFLQAGNTLQFETPVTFFAGENGTGKSTILEAIAVAYGFNAEGGTRNFRFSTVQTHSELFRHICLAKKSYPKDGFFLRAESLYNVASNIDEMDDPLLLRSYGGTSLHQMSHGESFLAIVQNRFGGNGLYLLDEPEAALSPSGLLTLMAEIHLLEQSNSQFIIATHSPILMAYPGADIYAFSKDGIQKQAYKETEHYQITKQFLDNPERMFQYLFSES